MHRVIMHVDMDAFYAAVEQRDNPELRGKPVIVGGGTRGVVSAASYEARKYGVHSALPMFTARKLCPPGVFLPVRMGRYKEVSREVMALLAEVSPLVEQVSIDEAYVDLTGTEGLHGRPEELAARLKAQVRERTGLTCSVGLAPNKFLAKIASDLNKPDGLTVIPPEAVENFLMTLPVEKIPGVGPKTRERLAALGVQTAGDIRRETPEYWAKQLGKWGRALYERALGIDASPVVPETEAKSSGAEDTLASDTEDREVLRRWLQAQAEEVGRDLRKHGLKGRTVTLKLKYSDFRQITRSTTLLEPTHSTQVIFAAVAGLLEKVKLRMPVRLVGVSVSQLSRAGGQGVLFPSEGQMRQDRLDQALDTIQKKFGHTAITRGRKLDYEPGSGA